jgi:hypothetical protein
MRLMMTKMDLPIVLILTVLVILPAILPGKIAITDSTMIATVIQIVMIPIVVTPPIACWG